MSEATKDEPRLWDVHFSLSLHGYLTIEAPTAEAAVDSFHQNPGRLLIPFCRVVSKKVEDVVDDEGMGVCLDGVPEPVSEESEE